MKLFLSFLLLFTFFFSGTVLSQGVSLKNSSNDPIKFPFKNKKKRIEGIWDAYKPTEKIELYLLDDFESGLAWKLKPVFATGQLHRFVARNPETDPLEYPDSGLMKGKYQKDLERLRLSTQIHFRSPLKKQNYAYEIRCHFVRPGKDFLTLSPSRFHLTRSKVQGLPRSFGLWVKGAKKKHVLYGLFRNRSQKLMSVFMGDLNFTGWKRMETGLPAHLIQRHPKEDNKYQIHFEGLKIHSHKSEEAGMFITVFDTVMLILEHQTDQYPGHEMKPW